MSIGTTRASIPASSRRRARASRASRGPETVHCSGPLTAARSRSPTRYVSRTSLDAVTLSIPPGAAESKRRPRSATSPRASGYSRTPARQAAVFSPILWPMSAVGSKPQRMS